MKNHTWKLSTILLGRGSREQLSTIIQSIAKRATKAVESARGKVFRQIFELGNSALLCTTTIYPSRMHVWKNWRSNHLIALCLCKNIWSRVFGSKGIVERQVFLLLLITYYLLLIPYPLFSIPYSRSAVSGGAAIGVTLRLTI